jgi:hypothetical protein
MNRLRLLALLPVLAIPLLLATSAQAETKPSDVAQALRTDPVFVESDAEAANDVEADKVRAQIREGSRPIYVAVLPQRAATALGSASNVALAVSRQLGRGTILIALVGEQLVAVAAPGAGLESGQAPGAVAGVTGGATDRLVTAVRNVQELPVAGGGSAGNGGGDSSTNDSGGGFPWLPVIAVLGVGGGGAYVLSKRRRAKREMEGLRADVESLYNRLGSDISTIPGGDDVVAKQALSDAAERYNATGALLANADTPGEFAAARRTAVEGLVAAQTARKKLGLDPGPEIPLPPSAGPQLTAEQKVRVGDQEFEGSPTYQPGRGHYYGGGYYNGQPVPGGWYSFPFWETMLMTSVLTGGFGGGGMFGGGGYERGYEEGVDDARRAGDDSDVGGGDWGGGGGGGDWGGGGGDWGGGGDSGGGGGDGGW